MLKVYVLTDKEGKITRYSTIPGTGVEVIQDDPIIDMSKLAGYEIILGDNNSKHLVYNQEKYDDYVQKEAEKTELENANDMFEEMAKEQILPTLSDEIAYAFKMLYPLFEIGDEYKAGDRIRYNSKFYKVLLDHTSQEDWTPDVAVSLFAEISDPAVEYPEFVQPINAETAYTTGDKVTFEGNKYVSLIDNNVYSPTAYPTGWQLVE